MSHRAVRETPHAHEVGKKVWRCRECSETGCNMSEAQMQNSQRKTGFVRMWNCVNTRMVRRNRQINFKMDFLICKSLELVIDPCIKLGKKVEEILLLF